MNPEVDDGVGDGFVPFQPRQLLWHTVRALLNAPEVDEVKRCLGGPAIDRNEVCDVDVFVFSKSTSPCGVFSRGWHCRNGAPSLHRTSMLN